MSVQTDSDGAQPSAPGPAPSGDAAPGFRARRHMSVIEAHRRRELLTAQAPRLDPQFVNAVAATDSFWGPDEQWRAAISAYVGDQPAAVEADLTQDPMEPAAPSEDGQRPRARPRRLPKLMGINRSHRSRTQPAPAEGEGQDSVFDVPGPGRRTRPVGRTRSWLTRLALIVGPLLMAGGLAYSCGVSAGSSRLVQQGSISSQDAAAFHLSTFPADRVAGLGVAYLTLCWTHPAPSDVVATQDRLAALAAMTSAGVTAGCGWTGTASSPAPLAVTWDGTVAPYQGVYADGVAARLGFVITTADQRMVGVSLPVWAPSATSAAGARVVGDVAVMPVATVVAAPTPAAPVVTDSGIAESLTRNVIVPFLRAWAASDPVQLNLVLARDASAAARTGMNGQLTTPTVTGVRVVVVRGDPTAYRDGDIITTQLTVDWARGRGVQRSGYCIGLRLTAGRWQVTDITGAAPDPAGGAAHATTFATPTSSPAPPAG